MPRYRNTQTGVVVDIPAELAASIGSFEPVERSARKESDDKPKEAKTATRRRSSKSDD